MSHEKHQHTKIKHTPEGGGRHMGNREHGCRPPPVHGPDRGEGGCIEGFLLLLLLCWRGSVSHQIFNLLLPLPLL